MFSERSTTTTRRWPTITRQPGSILTTLMPIWAVALCLLIRPIMAALSRIAIRLSSVSPIMRTRATTAAGRVRSWPGHKSSSNKRWPIAMRRCGCGQMILMHLTARGFVYLKLGDFNKAIADYDQSILLGGETASSLYGRGIAKLRKGETDAGNKDIAAASKSQPDIAEEFRRYGV